MEDGPFDAGAGGFTQPDRASRLAAGDVCGAAPPVNSHKHVTGRATVGGCDRFDGCGPAQVAEFANDLTMSVASNN
jgi:hypothetical protein